MLRFPGFQNICTSQRRRRRRPAIIGEQLILMLLLAVAGTFVTGLVSELPNNVNVNLTNVTSTATAASNGVTERGAPVQSQSTIQMMSSSSSRSGSTTHGPPASSNDTIPHFFGNVSSKEAAKIKSLKTNFQLRGMCPLDVSKMGITKLNNKANSSSNNSNNSNSTKYCPETADYMICYPQTSLNRTIYFPCPFRKGIEADSTKINVSRYCQPNGTWQKTNYDLCIKHLVKVMHPKAQCVMRNRTSSVDGHAHNQLECENTERSSDNVIYMVMIYANLIGFGITMVSVSLAIFIFMSIRSLRCVRNMIHCNMLFTFVFKCTGHIGFYIFVLSNSNNSDSIWESNDLMCVIFNILLNYSLLCSFFWMMIEAVYLITVIVAAYSSNKIKLWWYLVIGWILPAVPIVPYAVLTYQSAETSCSWIKPEYNSSYDMLIDVPIYILLAINFVLLIVILYVIITKLKNHNDAVKTKYSQYKKLTRATLVLFPLFGLTFGVFFWLPTDTRTLFSKVYYFVNIFLQTTQGVWVSFVYCFLNDEVKNAVKTKLRSWKITHVGSGLYALGSSMRHQSIPTLYSTQITSNMSTRHRLDSSNPTDPSRLPMLQEDKV